MIVVHEYVHLVFMASVMVFAVFASLVIQALIVLVSNALTVATVVFVIQRLVHVFVTSLGSTEQGVHLIVKVMNVSVLAAVPLLVMVSA